MNLFRTVYRRSECERANQLLWSLLSPEQRQQVDREGWFGVTAWSGNRYRIYSPATVAFNVRQVDPAGHEIRQYCAIVPNVPAADTMLAQKLLLETDESRFHLTANQRQSASGWVA